MVGSCRWIDERTCSVGRIRARRGDSVTVALLRCDGGEEVEVFTSDDPRLLEFIGDRRSSEE